MPATRLVRNATRHAPRRAPSPLPFISVVVPVRNEARFIGRLLNQLLQQNYDPERFEVLVTDGHSTDATCDIVQRLLPHHPNLRLLHNPKRLSSAARNTAIRAAAGEIIVVVDGHSEVDNPDYLLELAEVFAVSGADLFSPELHLGWLAGNMGWKRRVLATMPVSIVYLALSRRGELVTMRQIEKRPLGGTY